MKKASLLFVALICAFSVQAFGDENPFPGISNLVICRDMSMGIAAYVQGRVDGKTPKQWGPVVLAQMRDVPKDKADVLAAATVVQASELSSQQQARMLTRAGRRDFYTGCMLSFTGNKK